MSEKTEAEGAIARPLTEEADKSNALEGVAAQRIPLTDTERLPVDVGRKMLAEMKALYEKYAAMLAEPPRCDIHGCFEATAGECRYCGDRLCEKHAARAEQCIYKTRPPGSP